MLIQLHTARRADGIIHRGMHDLYNVKNKGNERQGNIQEPVR